MKKDLKFKHTACRESLKEKKKRNHKSRSRFTTFNLYCNFTSDLYIGILIL